MSVHDGAIDKVMPVDILLVKALGEVVSLPNWPQAEIEDRHGQFSCEDRCLLRQDGLAIGKMHLLRVLG